MPDWLTFDAALKIVTTTVAVCGGVLGWLGYRNSIRQGRRKQPIVEKTFEVDLSLLPWRMATITVTNREAVALKITGFSTRAARVTLLNPVSVSDDDGFGGKNVNPTRLGLVTGTKSINYSLRVEPHGAVPNSFSRGATATCKILVHRDCRADDVKLLGEWADGQPL